VPPHRRVSPEGRPIEDIAAQIRAERAGLGPGILAVERKGTAGVIGYLRADSFVERIAR
jgi:hypothetical protein